LMPMTLFSVLLRNAIDHYIRFPHPFGYGLE
jgi:hypothetical protein